MSKRLLIDVKAKEDANNKYLPDTESAGGELATGGSISFDSVTAYTGSKGYVDIDFSSFGYTFPLTIEGWAFEFDGSVRFDLNSGYTFNSADQMRDTFAQNMAVQGVAVSGFNITEPNSTTARFETDTNRSTDNGKIANLYVKIANDQPRLEIGALTTDAAPASGIFTVQIDGIPYSVDYTYSSTVSNQMVLENLMRALNGDQPSQNGVTINSADVLPDGFVTNGDPEFSNENFFYIDRNPTATSPTSLDFTYAVTSFGTLADTAVTYTSAKEFDGTIANGEAQNTDSIDFALGATNLITSLVQADGDFDNTLASSGLYTKIRDGINSDPDFSPDGAFIQRSQTLDVFVTNAGGVGDNLAINILGDIVSSTDTSSDLATFLDDVTALIDSTLYVSATNDGVDKITIVPNQNINIDSGDVGFQSSTSTFSATQGGATETDFVIPINGLRFDTTTFTSEYNGLAPQINITGDGAVTTSNINALSGGSQAQVSLSSQFGNIAKRRQSYISDKIYLKGFGGYILINSFPQNFSTQNEVLSETTNITQITTGNGIGFEDLYESFGNTNPYYNAFLKVNSDGAGNKSISNQPLDHIIFKIWKSTLGYINVSRVYFDDPIKSVTDGWRFTATEEVLVDDSDQFVSPENKFLVLTFPEKDSNVVTLSLNTDDGGNIGSTFISKVLKDQVAQDITTDLDNSFWARAILANDDTDVVLKAIKTEGD